MKEEIQRQERHPDDLESLRLAGIMANEIKSLLSSETVDLAAAIPLVQKALHAYNRNIMSRGTTKI